MKKIFGITVGVIGIVVLGFLFIHPSTEPPTPSVKAGDVNIPTTQGSYCWKGTFSGKCVDKVYASPLEMAKEHEPTEVSPGSKIFIQFKKEPMQDNFKIEQWVSEDNVKDVAIKNDEISAPDQSGVYVYYIIARWEQGDGNYAFSVRVK